MGGDENPANLTKCFLPTRPTLGQLTLWNWHRPLEGVPSSGPGPRVLGTWTNLVPHLHLMQPYDQLVFRAVYTGSICPLGPPSTGQGGIFRMQTSL